MSDIFISYAREDIDKARQLAKALEAQGWSVFWDRTIPPGQSWRSYIGKFLKETGCVIVTWSAASIDSDWVCEEADHAKRRRVLIPVLIEPVAPPLGFSAIHAADLVGWNGDATADAFAVLRNAVSALLGTPPVVVEKEKHQQAEAEAKRKAIEAERRKSASNTERRAKKATGQVEKAEAEKRRRAKVKAKSSIKEIDKPTADRAPLKERVVPESNEKPTASVSPHPPDSTAVPASSFSGIYRVVGFVLLIGGLLGFFLGDASYAKVSATVMLVVAGSCLMAAYGLKNGKAWAGALALIAVVGAILYFGFWAYVP